MTYGKGIVLFMKVKKNKHLSFEDRCVIEEHLNRGYNFTQISNRLQKHRTSIAKEVFKHRFLRGTASSNRPCCFESKPPYVCNNCIKFDHCKKQKYSYKAHIAYNEYKQTLITQRSHLNITKEQIVSINEIIAPLMVKKNHEFIRYILPKGTSFASLNQSDCFLIASHINSTPRLSLNNHSPYETALLFLGQENINKLQIKKIAYDDIDLSYRLLRK